MIKYSIVIPTYNKLEECLKPCIDSILTWTDFRDGDKEIVISANGCKDGTEDWVRSLNHPYITLVSDPKPLGYPKATNLGIQAAKGEYIIFLNNDCVLLEQPINKWIYMLEEGFKKHRNCGITGSLLGHNPDLNKEFAIFFCAMTTRSLINEIGMLDEIFETGAGEDTTFCIEAQKRGYTIHWAPLDTCPTLPPGATHWVTDYPIYHAAEATMHDPTLVENWQEKYDASRALLIQRYNKNPHRHILAEICTRDRYFTTLPLTLEGILHQTHKPSTLLIIDNSENKEDLRELPITKYILQRIEDAGIGIEILWGPPTGQHILHEMAQEKAKDLVWRLDDDVVPDPYCLERLLLSMVGNVGAVGGLVLTPPYVTLPESEWFTPGNQISEIYSKPNKQWSKWGGKAEEVDHLYCSFLYRKGIAHYETELSEVAHREETLFTYSIKRAGYRVILDPYAITYHYRNPEGGIRAAGGDRTEPYERDEALFRQKLMDWGVIPSEQGKLCYLNNGIGDHYVFLRILPEILEKHKTVTIACCTPDVFHEYKDKVKIISLAEAQMIPGFNEAQYSVYERGWNEVEAGFSPKHIEQLFREMYL